VWLSTSGLPRRGRNARRRDLDALVEHEIFELGFARGMRLAAAAMPSTSALFMNTTRTRPTISDRWLGLKRNADWRAEAVVLFRL
jgi:hypothetical protein